jgi:hypothetical protein
MKQNNKHNLVSLILVVMFCFGIFSEAFSQKAHANTQTVKVSQTTLDVGHGSSDACEDVVHHNQCHFGHCSHIYGNDEISTAVFSYDLVFEIQNSKIPKDPFIDSLRRPPRRA